MPGAHHVDAGVCGRFFGETPVHALRGLASDFLRGVSRPQEYRFV